MLILANLNDYLLRIDFCIIVKHELDWYIWFHGTIQESILFKILFLKAKGSTTRIIFPYFTKKKLMKYEIIVQYSMHAN